MEEKIRLTQYSKGGGCGCKIAPTVLDEILKDATKQEFKNLLVGNNTKDDAAVYDLGNGQALISTSDFFTPIVDDAFDFGRIAATNALSDVYAMGGKPIMALAILGWPVEKLPTDLAQQVLEGARKVCAEAGIPLAGGHSIDSEEPIFGLAVSGLVPIENIKRNVGVKAGDLLFLTKSLGTGMLSSALKNEVLSEENYKSLLQSMTKLNKSGEVFGKLDYVHALTDVTGFGLAGHLLEMLEGSGCNAEIFRSNLKVLPGVEECMSKFIFPNNTTRIYNDVKDKITGMQGMDFLLFCDPQTSGGLLVSVDAEFEKEFVEVMKENGLEEFSNPVGRIVVGNGFVQLINN